MNKYRKEYSKQYEIMHKGHCTDCGENICRKTARFGGGRCPSCATKHAFKENPQLIIDIKNRAIKRLSKPENNGMYGKHHTKETKQQISEKHIGKNIGEDNPNWQGGIWNNLYSIEFNDNLKEQIRDRDHHECQYCFKIEDQQIKEINKKLSIHHIDYSKNNCKEENLITLCNKCNCLANYNRDYWFAYFSKVMEALYLCQK
jgi:hypothetical protein